MKSKKIAFVGSPICLILINHPEVKLNEMVDVQNMNTGVPQSEIFNRELNKDLKELSEKYNALHLENENLHQIYSELEERFSELEKKIVSLVEKKTEAANEKK